MCNLCPDTFVTYVSRPNTQAKKVTRSPVGRVEALHFNESRGIAASVGMTAGEQGTGFRLSPE